VIEMAEEKKKLIIDDVPSCEFLEENIKDEEGAVETYIRESDRTNHPVMKETFHKIATDEMDHLKILKRLSDDIKCKKEK
jgi:rubrerythrin